MSNIVRIVNSTWEGIKYPCVLWQSIKCIQSLPRCVSSSARNPESGGSDKKSYCRSISAEAVFICQLDGIIGMALGILAGNGMALWIEADPVIPIWAVTMGFSGMLVIGIVFGVYPAYKVSQLDPIESLRCE